MNVLDAIVSCIESQILKVDFLRIAFFELRPSGAQSSMYTINKYLYHIVTPFVRFAWVQVP